MLSTTEGDDLAAYVVWAPKNGAKEKHVERALGLASDPRATQYWDRVASVAGPLDRMLDLNGPCAGIFALYPPGTVWTEDGPPRPVYFEDAHAREYGRAGPQFDADRLAEHTRRMMQ